jgi:hypothetical protein
MLEIGQSGAYLLKGSILPFAALDANCRLSSPAG